MPPRRSSSFSFLGSLWRSLVCRSNFALGTERHVFLQIKNRIDVVKIMLMQILEGFFISKAVHHVQ